MSRESERITTQRAELGRCLANHRQRNGFTQQELADRTYYDRTSISKLETGQQPAQRAFWCDADQLLGAGGDLIAGYDALAAAKAAENQADEHRSDQTADALFEALSTAMVPVARASNRVRSTSASPEEVAMVIELQALPRALTERSRRVLIGEPVDWIDIADQLDSAAKACRRRAFVQIPTPADA